MARNGYINDGSTMTAKSPLFSEQELERVNQAIQEAESSTSTEIVPVVAHSSGRYDRPEDIVGLWGAAMLMTVVWLLFPLPGEATGSWDAPAPVWQLICLLVAAVVGFVAGAVIGSRIDWLRRLFTPREQMRADVDGRARQAFFDQRIHRTEHGTGVLLYVSLFERMAVLLADQRVLDCIGQTQLDSICQGLTRRLHDGSLIDSLCDTTRLLGTQLAPHLPRADNDRNEHPDKLVVID